MPNKLRKPLLDCMDRSVAILLANAQVITVLRYTSLLNCDEQN